MAGRRLKLKFEDNGPGLVCGAAWVVVKGEEITPDCGTFTELDTHLRDLEADIAAIRKAAKRKFDHSQNKQR